LDSFGFLLDSPVLNIDTSASSAQVQDNQKFGKINLVGDASIAEIVFGLTDNVKKESADCLLAGLVFYTDNFKNKITANIFQIASDLMKKEADLKKIIPMLKIEDPRQSRDR